MNHRDFQLLGHTFLILTVLFFVNYFSISIRTGNINNPFDLIALFFIVTSSVMYAISMALFTTGKRFALTKDEQH